MRLQRRGAEGAQNCGGGTSTPGGALCLFYRTRPSGELPPEAALSKAGGALPAPFDSKQVLGTVLAQRCCSQSLASGCRACSITAESCLFQVPSLGWVETCVRTDSPAAHLIKPISRLTGEPCRRKRRAPGPGFSSETCLLRDAMCSFPGMLSPISPPLPCHPPRTAGPSWPSQSVPTPFCTQPGLITSREALISVSGFSPGARQPHL